MSSFRISARSASVARGVAGIPTSTASPPRAKHAPIRPDRASPAHPGPPGRRCLGRALGRRLDCHGHVDHAPATVCANRGPEKLRPCAQSLVQEDQAVVVVPVRSDLHLDGVLAHVTSSTSGSPRWRFPLHRAVAPAVTHRQRPSVQAGLGLDPARGESSNAAPCEGTSPMGPSARPLVSPRSDRAFPSRR